MYMYPWDLTPPLYLTDLLCVALEKDTLKGPPLVSENPKLEKQAPREVKASGGRPDGGTKSVPGTPPTQSGAVTPNKCRSPTCVQQVHMKRDSSYELTTRAVRNGQSTSGSAFSPYDKHKSITQPTQTQSGTIHNNILHVHAHTTCTYAQSNT